MSRLTVGELKQVIENFDGIVPQNMDDLLTLAGVGRKSANVILLEAIQNLFQNRNQYVNAMAKSKQLNSVETVVQLIEQAIVEKK